ncbi:hypothetical protein RJ639_039792 [Escallonia herrerae]|uniref:SAC domain-containing protein n=1 Tax=Escallonia herrerae TaxID=1293975 RepID=A0AA88WJ63_9ASTE|nr:hypothetical protein RJ639_039792 [Escallonia herrerae]
MEEWLAREKKILDTARIPNSQRLVYTGFMLEASAERWWKLLSMKWKREGLQTYIAVVDRALAIENDLEEQKNVYTELFRAPSYGGLGKRNSGNVNRGGRGQGNTWQGNFQRALQGRNHNFYRNDQGRSRGNLQGNAEKLRVQGRAYALESQEVQDTIKVIEGTLTIFQCVARVLFDPGSIHSFISSYMVPMLPQEPELLPYELESIGEMSMAKSDNPKSNSSNLPHLVPPAVAKIDQTNDPETDYSLEKFKLYETRARFYLIGSDRNKRFFRLLKIDRMEPSDLNISEDPVVYSPQEVKSLLQRIAEGNRATGGLTFVAKVYGIAGCIKFLESFYLIVVTKRRQIGCICGHAIYSIAESQIISIPHVSVQTDVAHSKTEQRYKKLLSSADLTKDFFYSYTYPIMQSLQKNVLSMGEEGMPYENIFVWNAFLTQEIRSRCKNTIWTIALVHGNFKQTHRHAHYRPPHSVSSLIRAIRPFAYTSSPNLTLPWAASDIVFYAAIDLVFVALRPHPVLPQHGHSRDDPHKQSLASLSASSSASRVAMALFRMFAASSFVAPGSRAWGILAYAPSPLCVSNIFFS